MSDSKPIHYGISNDDGLHSMGYCAHFPEKFILRIDVHTKIGEILHIKSLTSYF